VDRGSSLVIKAEPLGALISCPLARLSPPHYNQPLAERCDAIRMTREQR
jgi:hypothetical protein